jgi:uncharacterized membrane protein
MDFWKGWLEIYHGLALRRTCYLRQYWDPSQLSHLASRLLRLPAASFMAGCLLASAAPAWSAPPADPAPAQNSIPASKASFAHSGLKTVTYEVGNTLNNFLFLTAGVGGLAGGLLLTTFNTMQSWTVYTTNDYFWERLYPREPSKDGTGSFDVQQSAWRTTLKYMTGKPVVASIKIAAIYLYTGSAATALVFGTAATAGASVVFFVNNFAWDFYDQTAAPRIASEPQELPKISVGAAN